MKDYKQYKFAIKEILENKAGNKIPAIRKDLMLKLGITAAWLSRIINAKLDSKIKLEHEQLSIIADILKVKIDTLITKNCRLKIRNSINTELIEKAA